jgi:hypothetical protein
MPLTLTDFHPKFSRQEPGKWWWNFGTEMRWALPKIDPQMTGRHLEFRVNP